MKTTSIKGVLSFCVAVTVTVAMAYSAVTVIQKNNVATEKAVKESQAIGSEVSTDSLKDGEYEGSLIVLSHTVVFGVHYFPMLFTNPAAMPTRQMIAAIVTLILLAMLIPLFITSFKSVRRKMNGKTWKNIQRMAYPFFIGIYVHIMVLYSADVKSHMTGIIVYTVIYACYVILRLRKAALKSRKAKIATA